jgi:hypothetical protein
MQFTLEVFESKVLRKVFRLQRMQVKGGWRKLPNEEFNGCAPHQMLLGKGKFVLLHAIKVYIGDRYIAPTVLNLSAR